jgi:hypothetical protein
VLRRRPRGAAWATCGVSISLILLATVSQPVAGQEEASAQECCLALLFTIGARSLGLGEAVTARTGPGSLFVNPALLAGVEEDQFLVHNSKTSIDKSNTFTLFIHSRSAGSFALTYRLYNALEQSLKDNSGNTIGTFTVLTQEILASYATRVVPGVSAGVSYMFYQDRYDCRGACNFENVSATTHGMDLGIQVAPPSHPDVAFGASLQHLGFPLQVVNKEQASPLPMRARLGGAYEVLHLLRPDSTIDLWMSSDVVVNPRYGTVAVDFGMEAILEETISLRAGYGSGSAIEGGLGVGVGLRYDRFDISVAKSFISSTLDDSEPTQISFAIRF